MKGPGMRGKGTEARGGEDLPKNAKKIDLTLDPGSFRLLPCN